MIKKLCLLHFAIGLGLICFSQNDSIYNFTLHDGTIYPITIMENNPEVLPNLFFTTGALVGTRPLNDMDFMLPVQASFIYKSKAFIELKGDFPIIPRFDTQYDKLVENEALQTTNKFFINTQFEAVAGYFFLDTIQLKPLRIKFKAKLSNKTDTNMVASLKTNIRQSFGIRGGYTFYQSTLSSAYLKDGLLDENSNYLVKAPTETLFSNENERIYHTNFQVHTAFIGVDLQKNFHIVYSQSTDTVVRKSRIYNLYADFFYSPYLGVQPMQIRNFDSGEVNELIINDQLQFRYWGFRIGSEIQLPLTERNSFAFQVESGIRPGINNIKTSDTFFGNKMYIQTRVLYKFGTKINFTEK